MIFEKTEMFGGRVDDEWSLFLKQKSTSFEDDYDVDDDKRQRQELVHLFIRLNRLYCNQFAQSNCDHDDVMMIYDYDDMIVEGNLNGMEFSKTLVFDFF